MDLSALIERVEKLTGLPTGDLTDIYDGAKAAGLVTDWETELWFGAALRGNIDAPGAAVALVERVLPGCGLSVEHHPVYGDWWDAAIFDRIPKTIANARKKTAALAVCLAALRALQAQEGRDG